MRYFLSLLLAAAACSCSPAPKAISQSSRLPDQGGLVITRIAQRHQTILVRSGPSGPTYSLVSSTGEVLVGDMTLGQLALKNPELFLRVKSMQAGLLLASSD